MTSTDLTTTESSAAEADARLPELAGLRIAAPTDLAPAVLVRVGLADEYFTADAGIGPIFVAYNGRGVSATAPADKADAGDAFEAAFVARFGRGIRAARRPDAGVVRRVDRALADGRPHSLAFDLRGLTPFATDVLEGALTIPPGEIRPYAWLAGEVGRPKAVRAVGTALGHNPIPILIPAIASCAATGRSATTPGAPRPSAGRWPLKGWTPMPSNDSRGMGSATWAAIRPISSACRRAATPRRSPSGIAVPFASLEAARAAGYRGCKDCRPV